MKLSIIIPMYNVEDFVEKCLLSCLNQDVPPKDYEIICVDDGSPDRSLEIATELSKAYSNIRIVSRENGGLSAARNTGLSVAVGDYIWFIDSDDFIEQNCLGRITSKLDGDLDLLQIHDRLVYQDGSPSYDEPIIMMDGICSGKEIIRRGGIRVEAPFTIYRRLFLKEHNLRFIEGIYFEDSEFKPRVLYYAKSIASDNEISYNYLQRKGSITAQFNKKKANDLLYVCNSLVVFSKDFSSDIKKYYYSTICETINTIAYEYNKLRPDEKKDVFRLLKVNSHLFNSMTNSNIFKYVLEGYAFKINPSLGIFFYELLKKLKK